MIKIAMVCHRYYPDIGGVEMHVREISERLARNDFDVEVLCTDSTWKYPEYEKHNGVKIIRFKSIAPGNAFYFSPQMYYYIKNRRYDILHAHNYHAFPAFFASAAYEGRFIFTPHYHGGSQSYLRNILLRPYSLTARSIFEKAKKVVCVSQFEMKLIKNNFNVPISKLVNIPNGLNTEEFKNINSNFSTKPKTAKEVRKDSKIILCVGRLESYKGVQYLIKTLPLLRNFHLEVIGDGSYGKKLHELAVRLKVFDRIDWIKGIDRRELLSHFKSADVLVNLSKFESYGMTVAEALACGTPCIVVKGGALEEFINGGGCVGIDNPEDINTLAISIEKIKKISPKRMLDWNDVTSQLIKLYLT